MDKKYAIQTEHQWKLNYVDIELNPTVPQRVEVHLCSLGRVGWDLRQNHLPYFSDQIRLAQTSSSQMKSNSNLSFITIKQHIIRLAQTSPSCQWNTTLVIAPITINLCNDLFLLNYVFSCLMDVMVWPLSPHNHQTDKWSWWKDLHFSL